MMLLTNETQYNVKLENKNASFRINQICTACAVHGKNLRNFERFVVTKFCHYSDYSRALLSEEPRDHIMLYD